MRQLILGACFGLMIAGSALAQSSFSPAIRVNDDVITYWELDQRTRMYDVLGSPGDPADFAREQLIDDRVKMNAARLIGISVSEADIDQGVEDFAGRSGRSAAELLALLAQEGIEEETLRDFVESALVWRNYVRARFRGEARVSEADIDRALATASDRGSIRLRIAEIIIPTPPPERARAEALAEQISNYRSFERFSAAAREYSAAASRDDGGVLDWRDVSELPGGLSGLLLRLEVGEVTTPLDLQGRALALFQLRGIEEVPSGPTDVVELSWAEIRIRGGHSDQALAIARSIGQRADRCGDLYSATFGQGTGTVTERSAGPAEIPNDVEQALSLLDIGEISTSVTRDDGDVLLLLMLCDRVTEVTSDVSREQIRDQLIAQRLNLVADAHLQGLRADARIRQ